MFCIEMRFRDEKKDSPANAVTNAFNLDIASLLLVNHYTSGWIYRTTTSLSSIRRPKPSTSSQSSRMYIRSTISSCCTAF